MDAHDWFRSAIKGKNKDALLGTECYLSGPIEHEDDNLPDWRPPVIKTLTERFGINVHDPAHDEKQQRAAKLETAIEAGDFDTAEQIATCFVKKDLAIIDRCDFLVVYNPYKVPTTGTPCEVHHAVQIKKPVMIVCPEGKKNVSRWYMGYLRHRYLFGSWGDLYEYLDGVDRYKEYKNHRWWVVYGLV